MGSKNSAVLAHFIPGPRSMLRGKKCPRMKKRESKLPRDIAEDNPVLGQPKS